MGIIASRVPRAAFFTDSFHEANGVALTSREFAKFARAHFYPFFSVHPGPKTGHWKRGSFETYELGPGRFQVRLEHDLAFDPLFLRHLKELQKAVARFQPDLIHVTGPGHAGLLGAIVAHRLGVPLVASWHTNVHEYGARRLEKMFPFVPRSVRTRVGGPAERKALDAVLLLYSQARMLFGPNPELCSLLAERCGRPVAEMHRGVDADVYTPARRIRSDSRCVIGYVGRISTEKNVRMLAAVEALLRQRGLSECEFHVVGEGSDRSWLEARLPSAKFTGVLKGEALADAYAQMDVLLFPSETDTFGNVVLEAAASGVPSLVSALGGPKYLVENGVNGYVCTSAEEYAAAIFGLARDPELRSAMAAAARASALTRSWNTVFNGVYEQYRTGVSLGWLPAPVPRRSPRRVTAKTFDTEIVS